MMVNDTWYLLLTFPAHILLYTLPITSNPQQSTVSSSHPISPLTSVVKLNRKLSHRENTHYMRVFFDAETFFFTDASSQDEKVFKYDFTTLTATFRQMVIDHCTISLQY